MYFGLLSLWQKQTSGAGTLPSANLRITQDGHFRTTQDGQFREVRR
jgi:hypothetical protein